MESGSGNDPFLWDTDQVLQQLCTPDRTWEPPANFKLPNLDGLANRLVDLEIDGESLLTYQDLLGSLVPLMRDLHIFKVPHQLSFGRMVQLLQGRSPEYRRWKKSQNQAPVDSDMDIDEKVEKHDLGSSTRSSSVNHNLQGNLSPAPAASTNPAPVLEPAVDDISSVLSPTSLPPLPPADSSTSASPSALHSDIPQSALDKVETAQATSVDGSASEQPPRKKQKRIAPTLISTTPQNNTKPNFIPTEADIFTGGELLSPYLTDHSQNDFSNPAYLGPRKLTFHDMVGPDMTGHQDSGDQFSWMDPAFAPPGRRLQVNQAMKKYLRYGQSNPGNPGTPDGNDDDDDNEVLPLFGESDEEYDSETYREIEKEEEERLKAASAERMMLTEDEVTEGIRDATQSLADLWAETKKPGWDRKAYKLWNQYKRAGARKLVLAKAVSRLQRLDSRIAQICKEIARDTWRNKAELQRQTCSLEPSVFDREYERWLIKMLSSPIQPPKPHQLPKMKTPVRKPASIHEDEEEILTSDVDDGLDDFLDDSEDYEDDDSPMDMDIPPNDPMEVDHVQELDHVSGSSPHASSRDSQRLQLDRKPIIGEKIPTGASYSQTRRGTKDMPIDVPESPVDSTLQTLAVTPGLDDPAALAEVGLDYWGEVNDADRLVAAVLHMWKSPERTSLLNCVKEHEAPELWEHLVLRAAEQKQLDFNEDQRSEKHKTDVVAFMLARLFDVYISCSPARAGWATHLLAATITKIKDHSGWFETFCQLVRHIEPHLSVPFTFTPPIEIKLPKKSAEVGSENHFDDEEEDDVEEDVSTASSDSESDDDEPISPANKRRMRKLARDKGAEGLRETNLRQQEEYEERRLLLRERLAVSGSAPGDMTQFIINLMKKDDQGHVYVHPHIAGRIKPHQVEGVRFMWNQFVVVGQGCLLAHTMGLGKTMQVITLLVAIAEASWSEDPSISSQIPVHLKESKTLVLCPSGLADNWVDELLIWTPQNAAGHSLLGNLSRISSSLSTRERGNRVRQWAQDGGVLIIGYTMFARVCKSSEELGALLREKPNIVVADEAHHLKSQKSQIHKATAHFRTMHRLAMTGTPLANNVKDYYAMIDFVAPNYLSTPKEFDAIYDRPIKHGLWRDSSASDKRRALKMLNILKQLVAPKVHRMGISALKADLPTKKEFVIYTPLTDIQIKAYKFYVTYVKESSMIQGQMTRVAKIWSFVSFLANLIAHPRIFRSRLLKRKNDMVAAEGRRLERDSNEPTSDGEDKKGRVELPLQFVSELLAMVTTRNIEDCSLSWKVTLLSRILDESKRVGDKVLVFSQQILTLDLLEEIFRRQKRNYSRLDGGTPVCERQRHVKDFNNDGGSDVYLISTKAGGVGLNIYGANRVVILDFKYVPTDEQQAVGRAYRIGQKKAVYVYWLIAGGTYETVVQNRSVFKSQLSSRVVDKKNPIAWSKRNGNYFADPTIPPRAKNLSDYLGKDIVLDALLKAPDLADGIRSIIMTETFEEEEPDDHILTNEDRQEVSDWVQRTLGGQKGGQASRESSRHFGSTTVETPDRLTKRIIKIVNPQHMRQNRGRPALATTAPAGPQTYNRVGPLQPSNSITPPQASNGFVELSNGVLVPLHVFGPQASNSAAPLQMLNGVSRPQAYHGVGPLQPSNRVAPPQASNLVGPPQASNGAAPLQTSNGVAPPQPSNGVALPQARQQPQPPRTPPRMLPALRGSTNTPAHAAPAPASSLSPRRMPPAIITDAPQWSRAEIASRSRLTESPRSGTASVGVPAHIPQWASNPSPVGAMDPVTGAGTQIRAQVSPKQTDFPAGSNQQIISLNVEGRKLAFHNLLTNAKTALVKKGRKVILKPADIVTSVKETLGAQPEATQGIILLNQWMRVSKPLSSERLLELLLAGYLTAQEYALMEGPELERLVKRCEAMKEDEFIAMAWDHKDPDVGISTQTL